MNCQVVRISLRENHTLIIILGSNSVDFCAFSFTFRNGEGFFTESQSWKGLKNWGNNRNPSCHLWGFTVCLKDQALTYVVILIYWNEDSEAVIWACSLGLVISITQGIKLGLEWLCTLPSTCLTGTVWRIRYIRTSFYSQSLPTPNPNPLIQCGHISVHCLFQA